MNPICAEFEIVLLGVQFEMTSSGNYLGDESDLCCTSKL